MSSANWGDSGPSGRLAEGMLREKAKTIGLAELFQLSPSPRQAMINACLEVRHPDEGWIVRCTGRTVKGEQVKEISFSMGPHQPRQRLTTQRKSVSVREGIYLYSRWGAVPELKLQAPDRYNVIEEFVQTAAASGNKATQE